MPRAAQPREQVGRVARARARDALDLRLVGQQRGAHRRALLGAVHVARRRGDRHQRLELAHRPPRDLGRPRLHPWVHGPRKLLACRRVPELPEMEITARRLGEALPGLAIESVMTPGLNVLKTFDPPLHAADGGDVHRRAPARQAAAARPRHRGRRAAHVPHPPDERGAAAAVRQARLDEGPHLARAAGACPRTASCGCASSAPSRPRGSSSCAPRPSRPTSSCARSGRRPGRTRPSSARC